MKDLRYGRVVGTCSAPDHRCSVHQSGHATDVCARAKRTTTPPTCAVGRAQIAAYSSRACRHERLVMRTVHW
jgi:hypothetical protein